MDSKFDDTSDYEPFDYDKQTIAVMKRVLTKSSNCVDVGCHTGSFLDIILQLAPYGIHLGFEPIPDLYRKLKDKYSKYAHVTIYGYALSDTSGETSFQHVIMNKAYSGLKKRRYDRPNESVEEIKVNIERFDNMVPKDLHMDFIKIDVEGAELQVLRGAMQTIRTYKPVIVFEHGLGAADHYGTKPEDIFDLLTTQCGLRISLMMSWLKGGNTLSRVDFSEQFNTGKNYYFMAHQ
jgi:FkbM family methyltransferase